MFLIVFINVDAENALLAKISCSRATKVQKRCASWLSLTFAVRWMGGGRTHTFIKQNIFAKSCGLPSTTSTFGSAGPVGMGREPDRCVSQGQPAKTEPSGSLSRITS
jgi:hypothetical protein